MMTHRENTTDQDTTGHNRAQQSTKEHNEFQCKDPSSYHIYGCSQMAIHADASGRRGWSLSAAPYDCPAVDSEHDDFGVEVIRKLVQSYFAIVQRNLQVSNPVCRQGVVHSRVGCVFVLG